MNSQTLCTYQSRHLRFLDTINKGKLYTTYNSCEVQHEIIWFIMRASAIRYIRLKGITYMRSKWYTFKYLCCILPFHPKRCLTSISFNNYNVVIKCGLGEEIFCSVYDWKTYLHVRFEVLMVMVMMFFWVSTCVSTGCHHPEQYHWHWIACIKHTKSSAKMRDLYSLHIILPLLEVI
jgi:hypothetical protein